MKTIGASLKTHLAGEVLSVAYCIKLVLTDATTMGFTDHDEDIVYDGVTYESSTAHNLSAHHPKRLAQAGPRSQDAPVGATAPT